MPGVQYISSDTFSSCSALAELLVSRELAEIGEYAINDVTGRVKIQYIGTEADWKKTTVGENNLGITIAKLSYNPCGDANGDGKLTAADAVVLQKWLLAAPEAAVKLPEAADVDFNARVDARDLTLLKQSLLGA